MAQISNKTKNSVNGMKSKFSSPALNRFMGGETTTKKSGSTGENQKTKQVKSENKTATKIAPLEQGNNLVDMLLKIYTFLQKTHNEDKMNFEKMNQFREETKSEDDARQQRLLDAIKALTKPGKEEVTAEQEKESSNIIDSILGGVAAVATLTKVLRFFTGPLGIAILGATTLFELINRDKNPEATTAGMLTAGDVTRQAASITEAQKDTITGRKNRLLAARPENKKAPWWNPIAEAESQKKYLQEIGFDEKTGLTAAEKEAGYTDIDENFNPIRKVETPTAAPTATPTGTATEQPSGSTPAPVSTPTSTPVQSNATSSPEPMVSSPVSERLNQVQTENNTAKINDLTESSTTVTNNVTQSTAPNRTESLERTELPAVRNTEETFQKMIYYSTRVV